jgi:hypothetical protein
MVVNPITSGTLLDLWDSPRFKAGLTQNNFLAIISGDGGYKMKKTHLYHRKSREML